MGLLCCVLLILLPHPGLIHADIYHGGLYIGMAHQLGDRLDIHPSPGQVRGKCPPEPMRMDVLHTGPRCDLAEDRTDSSIRDPLVSVI